MKHLRKQHRAALSGGRGIVRNVVGMSMQFDTDGEKLTREDVAVMVMANPNCGGRRTRSITHALLHQIRK